MLNKEHLNAKAGTDHTEKHLRRSADKLLDQSDHDLLINHTVKLEFLCDLLEDYHVKFDKFSESSALRCEARHEKIIDKSIFKWIIGILIFVIISVATTIGIDQIKISNQHILIMKNAERIKENKAEIDELKRTINAKLTVILEEFRKNDPALECFAQQTSGEIIQ